MIEPTGERFIPELMGGHLIEAEHVVRYALAAQIVAGRDVLDAGCGLGWGTEMLLKAGAASAHGIDIDEAAIADARVRAPGASFKVGDLRSLPYPDASFDLVVCFEAIEHIDGHERVLDELVRVLRRDGGLLLVSSPNPAVYPAGNPFHVRELAPDELRDAVAQRLPLVESWHQFPQVASVLVPESMDLVDQSVWDCTLTVPVRAGQGPYSLVVAGGGALPRMQLGAAFAPSGQLDHLAEASEQIDEQRHTMDEDQRRVAEERRLVLAEREELLSQLREADLGFRELQQSHDTERSGWSEERQLILAEREDLLAQLRQADVSIRSLLQTHDDERSAWHGERERLRRDRERTAWLLVDAEQRVASLLSAPERSDESAAIDREIDALVEIIENLRQEVSGLRSSTSWRVTRPLRGISGLLGKRES
jgi:SAM-dependent methyltransferase